MAKQNINSPVLLTISEAASMLRAEAERIDQLHFRFGFRLFDPLIDPIQIVKGVDARVNDPKRVPPPWATRALGRAA
jgi:hypothetical protein